jgi:3-hydroxybutyryl-CoA dehydrogenase
MAKIAVIGGGRMGSGIAHAYLLAGNEVFLVEANNDASIAARDRIKKLIQNSIDRGAEVLLSEVSKRLTFLTSIEDLPNCRIAIEAVPEIPALKNDVLSRLDSVLSKDAIIASNTSSISINELAKSLKFPERFVGMHFFNPVPASQLVEIIFGTKTKNSITEIARESVVGINKTPIIIGDSPGFATSRLGLIIGLEAIRMVEEGVASAEDIDKGMVLAYKYPVGPLKLTDMVGLDVRLAIAEYLHSRLGDRFEPPALLRKMVAEGKLGQKSGEGFYKWEK